MTVSKRAFDALLQHRTKAPLRDMRQAFDADPLRFKRFSLHLDDILLDWSKCAVSAETMKLLHDLAKESDVERKRDQMFEGELINTSEQRAVLHVALRNRSNRPIRVDGKDVMPDVNRVLTQMRDFTTGVRSGAIATASGKRISDVVNIGIGGSDLGPAMTTLALGPYHDGPKLHFVSNIDGAHLADTIKNLDPARTLFLVASKTFTTIETMTNAHSAREWIVKHLGETAVSKHFAAISTALDKVRGFGIGEERTFGFWDWVGGRYSVWSAIGLPLMIAIGPENFGHFLAGAHAMDEHFKAAPLEQNLPITLGLIGAWHRNICSYATRAVIPYDQRLSRLPAYLQQLDMESNGKGVERDGRRAETETGPIVWGEPGTNGQHAFFQLIHQGTSVIPVEFLIAAQSHEPALAQHHDLLMANCLAQSEALMRGRTLAEAKKQLIDQGKDEAEAERVAPHRVFTGNRPSVTIAYKKLDPQTLGRLIALYEHRVFVEAAIWNINAFDQWGVELGKELATGLLPIVEGKSDASGHDASTQGLVAFLRGLQ
jgi:glucose-6-phosphate isomerase